MARTLDRQAAILTPTQSQAGQRTRLPLGMSYGNIKARFTGTYKVGTNPVTPYEDSPYGILTNVQLVLGGSFPLKAADARFWRFWTRITHNTDAQFTAPNGAGGASTAIVAEFALDLEQPDLLPPLDRAFWLDSRRVSNLETVVDFGNQADIAPANTGATDNALTSPQVVFASKEIQDRGGPTSRMQVSRQQYASLAVGDDDMVLTALGPAYRAMILHALSTQASGSTAVQSMTSDDTIINTLSVIADNVRYVDARPYNTIREENKSVYALETMPPGWVILDWAKHKNLQDLLQTGNRRSLTLRTNVSALPAGAAILVYLVNGIILTQQGRVMLPGARRVAAVATRR